MSVPAVSIGMPVRNGAAHLREAIDSILGQTFTDFELILSDNASDDATSAICQEYSARDRRIHYHRFTQNVGAARNYNRTFELARGRYFKWAAHDDLCLPEFLNRCVNVLESASTPVSLVYARTELIDAEGRPLGLDPVCLAVSDPRPHRRLRYFLDHVRMANPILGVIPADLFRRTRLHDTFISADLVLLGELQMLGEFCQVPEVLLQRRWHQGQSRQANPRRSDLQAWFDPTQRATLFTPPVDVKLTVEYARSALRIPARFSDRWRCFFTVLRARLWDKNLRPRLRRWFLRTPSVISTGPGRLLPSEPRGGSRESAPSRADPGGHGRGGS